MATYPVDPSMFQVAHHRVSMVTINTGDGEALGEKSKPLALTGCPSCMAGNSSIVFQPHCLTDQQLSCQPASHGLCAHARPLSSLNIPARLTLTPTVRTLITHHHTLLPHYETMWDTCSVDWSLV